MPLPFDTSFLIATLPTTAKGTAKVNLNHGVKVNHLYYWNDVFRDPEVERKHVPIRYDPYDAGILYAFAKGQWVRCISQYYAVFQGRSEREIQLASTELRQQNLQHTRRSHITATKLAAFITSAKAQESLLKQRLCDEETQKLGHKDRPSVQTMDTHHILPEISEVNSVSIVSIPSENSDSLYGDY